MATTLHDKYLNGIFYNDTFFFNNRIPLTVDELPQNKSFLLEFTDFFLNE